MSWLVFLGAAAITLALFVSVPALSRGSDSIARLATRLAAKQLVAEVVVFIVALLLAAAPSIFWSLPLPSEPDEFSYLLAADTFAHGRLSNPPHAMADALEFGDVIQRPTYASKHPPAQGLLLAIGLRLLNLPILGVWIAGALACAAIAWMLRPIAPPQWAFLAGVLAAMHPLIASWNQCYWGGNIAMLGGAITFGAAMRMTHRSLPRDAIIAGLGLSFLAISRPFEGAIFALVLSIFIVRRARFRNLILVAIPVVPTLLFLAHYDATVTHDWKLFPHRLHQQQYMITPRFFWERPNTNLTFASPIMRDFAALEFTEYQQHVGWRNYFRAMLTKTASLTNTYLPPSLLFAAIGGAVIAIRQNDRPARIALAIVVLLPMIHLAMIPITRPPYFAPIIGPMFVLIVAGIRSLSRLPRVAGINLMSLVVAITLTTQAAAWIAAVPSLNQVAHSGPAMLQAQQIDRLTHLPGKHLVLVRYTGTRTPLYDFVHNGADIDGAKIVFARSIDPERDRVLQNYFRDRDVWLLSIGDATFSFEQLTPPQ
ncbi:hypothetical protein BH09PLA1_BH09PLA1_25540 [soil metagenome]